LSLISVYGAGVAHAIALIFSFTGEFLMPAWHFYSMCPRSNAGGQRWAASFKFSALYKTLVYARQPGSRSSRRLRMFRFSPLMLELWRWLQSRRLLLRTLDFGWRVYRCSSRKSANACFNLHLGSRAL